MEPSTARPAWSFPTPRCFRRPSRLGAVLAILAPVLAAVVVAAPPTAASDQCTRLGPDSTLTVTGSYRIKNAGCDPGPWRNAPSSTTLDLADGDYAEVRGPGATCTDSGVRGQKKADGSTYCGPAWETRNDPVTTWG